MKTQLWRLAGNEEDGRKLREAAALLRNGEVVAFPTETVYGLGANGLDADAVRRIFAAKGRPADNPLILHIAEKNEIKDLASGLTPNAIALAEAFWPGPLTLVIKSSGVVPDEVTAGLDTVAVRMPNHEVARELIRLAGCPLAAPSANKSGRPSPTKAQDVLEDMDGLIAGILDGGGCAIGVESTVVDTTLPVPMILRPGGITREMLEEVVGAVGLDPALESDKEAVPRAPGMKYRHYAPKAPMYLLVGRDADIHLARLAQLLTSRGVKVGIVTDEKDAFAALPEGLAEVKTYGGLLPVLAGKLYQWLREFDRAGVAVILAKGVPENGLGLAVMNRLRKAAGNNVLLAEGQNLLVQSGTRPDII
ncbi:MAG: threonylcarbamoyl-AMP synthase [Acholeplasmataceae bacterium]|nr:L-threonylcarbamoyladenylate synthase [Acidaminococcaceae bacterium]NLY83800.1 threonylcarbamoyl-AMP synthase [Acholeplasmataceae bacterium]